jgi:7-cyano-7-deazaguanine synthase
MRESSEVMVLLSGGIDSMACLHFFQEMGRKTCALFIDYGQPAASREAKCVKQLSRYFKIHLISTIWKPILKKRSGYIPSRNAFLLTTALMEKPPAVKTIVLGIHAGTSYSDCQPSFIHKIQQVYDLYCKKRVRISCPFLDFQKGEIYAYCIQHHLPLDLTYSCEARSDRPCGKCLSCKDRELLHAGT